MEESVEFYPVEKEWVSLMAEAKELGLSIQEIRVFLAEAQEERRQD